MKTKLNTKTIVAAVASVIGLAVYGYTSMVGYLAASATSTLPVVLTVAGDSDALPGTENGAAKVTPLEMYPTKGRATGGVRSQRFLKGQNTLILAWVGLSPLHASTSAGSPVELPKPDMRRDGSGVDLASPIAFIA